jgi:tryptophan synthase alpha chain
VSTRTAFDKAKADGRAALVGYLPAGFPTYEGALKALHVMVEGGCDVIELGLPYSDPVMDGPQVQAAAQQALDGGIRTADVLRTVEAIASTGVPTVIMTYWNPVEHYGGASRRSDGHSGGASRRSDGHSGGASRRSDGHSGVERFAADLANAGGAGLITPDITPDYAGEWIAAADAHDLDKVFLVAPSSTD